MEAIRYAYSPPVSEHLYPIENKGTKVATYGLILAAASSDREKSFPRLRNKGINLARGTSDLDEQWTTFSWQSD